MKFVKHSLTSFLAAVEIEESADNIRSMVYRCIKRDGPLTDEQIQVLLKLNPSTERPRRIELVERGLVRDSGRVRRTRSGRAAVAWEAIKPKDLVL